MNSNNINDEILDILPLINHPIRVDILKFLYTESRSFKDLLRLLSIEYTSKLSFHLSKLAKLVNKDQTGSYELTELGIKAYHLLLSFENHELTNRTFSLKNQDSNNRIKIECTVPTIKKILFQANPSILILLLACIVNFLIHKLVISKISKYYLDSSPDAPIAQCVLWYLIFYVPIAFYLLVCYYYNFPFKYSVIGGLITLFSTFFFLKYPIGIVKGVFFDPEVPLENQLYFLRISIGTSFDSWLYELVIRFIEKIFFNNNLPFIQYLNLVFVLSLIFYSFIFLILVIPLKAISKKEKEEEKMTPSHFYVPRWLKVFWIPKTWFLLSLLYIFLTILSGNPTIGINGTIIHKMPSETVQDTIKEKNYLVPPLGYLIPQLPLVIMISLVIYIIINIEAIPSLIKNISTLFGVLFLPFIHLFDYLLLHQHYIDIMRNTAFYWYSNTDTWVNITGIKDFFFMRISYLCFEIIIVAIIIALLLKFIIWGSKFRKINSKVPKFSSLEPKTEKN